MSDQEVINEGRKNRLEDTDETQVTVSLRDQIPNKLAKQLREDNIGEKVAEMWSIGNANRAEILERQKEYLQSWDEFLVSTDDGAFAGSSNLHLPVTLIVCKTLHARFLQALIGIDPPFSTKARTEASTAQLDAVQDTMRYAIKKWSNRYEGAEAVIDAWIWDWITVGHGVLKLRWDAEFTRYMDVKKVLEEGAGQIVVGPDGNQTVVPTVTVREEEVVKVKKIFEGPVFEPVLFEDLLILNGKGNPQKADAVIHRSYMTASSLWTLADRKVFDEDEVEEVIKSGPDNEESGENAEIKQRRANNAGLAQVDTSVDLDRYEILEAYLKVDVDGSGINSDVIVWVHNKSRKLLRATYLHRVNKSGERPFFKIDYHLRRDQDYGIGIPEMMYPLSVEMDALHNMRIDWGMLSTMPFGFYRPTSGINPEVLALQPGTLIPVDNPQTDIYFPNLGNRVSFGYNEESAIQNLIDRLTSVSDLNLGILSSSQGAARTATGARALIGESSSNLDVHLRRLSLGWTKALQYLFHMLQQRVPEGLSFRITGDEGSDYWRTVKDASDIAGDFDFEIEANSSASNQQVRIANADTIAQLQQDMLAIQLGIVGPAEIYEAKKAQLQARGIKDINKFLRKPQVQRLMTPAEEVNRILRGMPTPVTPEGDHEGYLRYYQEVILAQQEALATQYPPEVFIALEAQAQQHAQMLQALEQMAAQNRNMMQQQVNQSQGSGANQGAASGGGEPSAL